jgi:tetratricopeptide (TPR) repeat protein
LWASVVKQMPAGTRRRATRQRAKGPIDPKLGERVRALRLARGLTQGDLAGTDFTKGFISLVETGRTRVSLRAAQILAERIGVGVTDLMNPPTAPQEMRSELQLLEAETRLRAGDASRAVELVTALRSQLSGKLGARADRVRGLALLASGRAREAIPDLESAHRVFESGGDRELAVRTTFDLAQAYGRADAHGQSLALALESERALEAGTLVDRTLQLQVLAYLASKFVTIGDAQSAEVYGERARVLAEDVSDPRSAAHLYLSLAVTRREQGDLEAALKYAREGLSAYERLGDQRQIGSTWNTLGWVYLARGQHGRAAEALRRAEQLAEANGDRRLLGYVLQTRAELELARGKAVEAVRLADASIAAMEASPRCRALSLLVRAQAIAATKASPALVRRAFDEAFRALEPEGRGLLARAHQAYFDVLRNRGDFKAASKHADQALELLRPSVS